jgi:hypothetical protein
MASTPDPKSTPPTGGKLPLIFMFQPTEFEVATGERLAEWEELMKTQVGLGQFAELKDREDYISGFETISLCPGAGADDCDWHEPIMAEA